MINKIKIFYQLLFDRFKLELNNQTNLEISVPENVSEAYKEFAKQFITENKEFIISVLKNNNIIYPLSIIRFDLINNSYPLSCAQERLWFIEQYEEGTNVYNVPITFKLLPETKIDIIKDSIKSIVNRHKILRTLIKEDQEGNISQLILDLSEFPLEIATIKITSYSQLDTYLHKEACHIYDLSKEYPIRVCLYELNIDNSQNNSEYYLSIVIHHIAFDGWSREIFYTELEAYYKYHLEKLRDAPFIILELPDLNIQYKDFALWQRHYLSEERLAIQLNHWKEKLEGYETLNLITDRPRPKRISYQGANIYFEIDEETSISLRGLAKELKVSLYSVMLAGYYLMLRSYSNQVDITLGIPIANRQHMQTENLIGFFVNSLALRIKIDTGSLIKEFVQNIAKELTTAQFNQDLTFEKLVEKIDLDKDTSRHPIFQVLFAVQSFGDRWSNNKVNTRDCSINITNLLQNYDPVESLFNTAKLDISTYINDNAIALKGYTNYSTALYDDTTIQRFIETYIEILKQLACLFQNKEDQESITIKNLSYINKDQYNKIICYWNQRGRTNLDNKVVHTLFKIQAEKTPDNIAIIHNGASLTYKELHERSNQLAHYLQKLGVGADKLVAVIIERSPDMIISLLSVLKAGGAYVPIDPTYSTTRLKFILDDTKASIILTDKISYNKIPTNCSYIISVDEEWNQIEKYPITNVISNTLPNHLAYVIYTSGTTGNPKGVMIEHKGVINLLVAQAEEFGLLNTQEVKHCLWYSNYVFDAHVSEIYTGLLNGHVVHIINNDVRHDISLLSKYIELNNINIATVPPTLLNDVKLLKLDTLIVAGDKVTQKVLDFYLGHHIKVINAYGPTEVTVCATLNHFNDNKNSNIGKPIFNTQCYVLGDDLAVLPVGAVGELHVGGVGLARGYLNLPELTVRKFIYNPFQTAEEKLKGENTRLYKTGDLVRWLPDGNLEYVGRNDNQVKIRGFRVELGEIENTLLLHKEVKQAVVLAREDITDQKKLVGYIVLKNEDSKDSELKDEVIKSLRELTFKSLPEYMQLSQIVILDKLPLTYNGKIDRKALPVPEEREGISAYHAPENLLEKKLAIIWQDILQIEKVGRNDNFFNLGGHSLKVLLLIARLRSHEGIEVPIDSIFQYPILNQFATFLTNTQYLSQSTLPLIQRANREQDILLSFAQQRIWFTNQLLTTTSLYHISRAIKLNRELDVLSLKKALNHMVKRHEILRTLIINKEGIGLQVILGEDTLFNLSEVSFSDQEELNEYLTQETTRAFNFEKEPLCRASLITCSENYILLITFHHIISDNWSEDIWIKELSTLYNSYNTPGIKPNLPPLPIQYADFSIWQRNCLSGAILKKQLNYWQRQLDIISTLELPTDYPRPRHQNYKANNYKFKLNQEITKALIDISRDNGTTLFMTMLTVFQGMLSQYTNQTDIVIGTPISGRRMQETENLIGCFVNILVLRVNTKHNPTFKEFLSQVKEVTLEAYSNQDIPFEQLVESLNIPRDPSRHPIVQVMFAFQNQGREELKLGNIKGEEIEINNTQAKLDLTLHVIETSEGLNLKFEYADDLFKQKTIEKLCGYYRNFIDEIIYNQNKRLSDTCILGNQELTELRLWSGTNHEYSTNKTIHQLFEDAALKTPDRIAVSYEKQQINYMLLNQQANQLAHFLIKEGVELETRVAILLPRSLEMIIGLLAILKSGGAYIPLDPDYPYERIYYILKDSQASMLLTTQDIADRLILDKPELKVTLKIIHLDAKLLKQDLKSEKYTNPNVKVYADNLCYIIYTSGSTGKPKGVNCIHRGMVNRLLYPNSLISVPDNSIGCLQSNFAFIDATWDIFSILTSNSRLVLYKELISRNTYEALKVWATEKIDRVTVTPSIINTLIEYLKEEAKYVQNNEYTYFLKIKNVKVTGEYFDTNLAQELLKRCLSQMNLFDCYGATEATSIIYRVFDKNTLGKHHTHILSNTKIYILDAHLNQVPIGIIGELYVGGVGLARGYTGKPGLTAERFIANPYIEEDEANIGSRLYKTGDLVRWLPDGNLEYIGRNDNQVKIRGFRIELGEIENTLLLHNEVKQAVVLAREDITDQKKLVGYVVLKNESSKDTESKDEVIRSLRELMVKSLPEYMQLSQIVILDKLPLTYNGKIDRKALPIPQGREGISVYQVPEGLLEKRLAIIWQDILQIEKVGRNDNFFNLGGHSLKVLLLIARLRSQEGIEVPIHTIFQYPILYQFAGTLEKFCKHSDLSIKSKNDGHIVQITDNICEPYSSPLYLIHEALGIIQPYFNLKNMVSNPIYALEDPYIGERSSGFTNIKEMVDYYAHSIKMHHHKYYSSKSISIGGWSFGAVIAYEIAILLKELLHIDNLILIDRQALNEKHNLQNFTAEEYSNLGRNRNLSLLSNYKRTQHYNGKLILIRAKIDSHMVTSETNLTNNNYYYGWEQFAREITLYEADGDHYSLFHRGNVISISKILNNILRCKEDIPVKL